MKKKIKEFSLSVIIPCYNEEKNLNRGVLDQVYDFMSTQTYPWEVIVVNDESTDNSLSLLNKFAKKHPGFIILDLPHGGKPSALKGGLAKAKYNHVLFTDTDQSTPISELSKIIPYFNKGFDVVIGSRGIQRDNFSAIRKIGSAIFSTTRRLLLLPNIVDTQCGFKAFKTKVARSIFPHLAYFQDNVAKSGWAVSAYDVEFLFIAQKMGHKIREVRVLWQDEDISSTKGDLSKRYKKESILMAKEVYRITLKNLQGGYVF